MKKTLLGTIAVSAFVLLMAGGAQASDGAVATQQMNSSTTNNVINETNSVLDAVDISRNGDVNYGKDSFNAKGLFTLQNQTGLNDAANNGANIAAQADGDAAMAQQALSATVSGNSVVLNNLADNVVYASRTGDVNYANDSFNAPGVFTLQNQTGMNSTANNGLNVAASF